MTEAAPGKWSLVYTDYDPLVSFSESPRKEERIPLETSTEEAALQEAGEAWRKRLAIGTYLVTEESFDKEGAHERFVTYPHSPRLVYELDVKDQFDNPLNAPRYTPTITSDELFETKLNNTLARIDALRHPQGT